MTLFSRLSILAFAPAIFLSGSVQATGINCHGSIICSLQGTNMMAYLHTQIVYGGGDPNHVYHNGDKVACSASGICVFLQGTDEQGLSLQAITNLMGTLIGHECRVCGSVPIFYPTENDISLHGMLTVNYSSRLDGCQGFCKQT